MTNLPNFDPENVVKKNCILKYYRYQVIGYAVRETAVLLLIQLPDKKLFRKTAFHLHELIR